LNILTEIENKDIRSNSIYIYYLGQSGYVIRTHKTIVYVDPYLSDYVENLDGLGDRNMLRNYPSPIDPQKINSIDAVFVTHEHADHMDPWTLQAIPVQYKLYCTEIAHKNNPVNIKSENCVYVIPGQEYNIKDITVIPILSAHHEPYDQKTGKPISVSFVIKLCGRTLYFWGDGIIYDGILDTLREFSFDCFFAPINGRDWFREKNNIIGNINIRELVGISKELNIDCLVPNHFDMFDCNTDNPEHFIFCLKGENPSQKFRILKGGECIEV
jgi:L-ascorbate 6-phosphate lactonase